uniref:Cytochrome P450 n=1 Tax=uncultured haloarchaeon FLAS10H9 TaxID=447098 RepID=A7U0T4_9EURY|nr:cytochrome P450 [uncultured haloarchaeon FLAS10H9]
MTRAPHTPPGPPVVGNVPRFADDPLRFLVGVQEAYGGQYPVVRLEPAGGQRIVVILDAALVHEILADRERFVRPRAGPEASRREGLLSSRGPLWERQRSVIQPELVGGQLAAYADIAARSVEEMLDRWPENGEIDLVAELSMLTMQVIARSLLGRDATREQARTVYEALDTFAEEFEFGADALLLPDALQSGPSAAFERADADLEAVARDFVDWQREHEDPPDSMLTALIEAERDGVELSEDELIDQTVLFLTAGQETTALTIAYAFHHLSRSPDVRAGVTEEATGVLDGAAPSWEHLSGFDLTERVVRETLRLTPAAWNVTREVRGPTTLGGTRFETDDLVLLPTYAHQREDRVWGDGDAFRPARWTDEVSRSHDSYFPFGSGPRVCIGRQVALTEAQFTLAHTLQQYEVDVHGDELAFEPAITLRPADGLRATVTERE